MCLGGNEEVLGVFSKRTFLFIKRGQACIFDSLNRAFTHPYGMTWTYVRDNVG